jgi:hypothetical protein
MKSLMRRLDRQSRAATEGPERGHPDGAAVCQCGSLFYDGAIIGVEGDGAVGIKLALAATIMGAAMVAGCQGGGESQRQAMIDEGVKSCVQGFNKSGGAAAGGIDGQRVCQCALTKMTDGKSVEEIRAISKQSNPSEADLQAMGACVVEEAQRQGVIQK